MGCIYSVYYLLQQRLPKLFPARQSGNGDRKFKTVKLVTTENTPTVRGCNRYTVHRYIIRYAVREGGCSARRSYANKKLDLFDNVVVCISHCMSTR